MPADVLTRPSDSPFVRAVTRVAFDGDGGHTTTPDGLWDLAFLRRGGALVVLQTGVITRPVALDFGAGDEYVCVSFEADVYAPARAGRRMVDRAEVLAPAAAGAFRFAGDALEVPTFENAEGLVDRLIRRGHLVRDDVVAGVLAGEPVPAGERTVQRRFARALGLSPKRLAVIRRADAALRLLREGATPSEAAFALGYADQPHLTRELRRFVGQTPGQVARQPDGE
ncbi:MAG TPA: AraC family transcriptional regulator [Bacteroidetes bacterium]|nr:AraC family transcriptional regulator [Bacteroidota bacterium]HIL58704.1 AraC family transcriptional regulator [Rhodothermales bacterium]